MLLHLSSYSLKWYCMTALQMRCVTMAYVLLTSDSANGQLTFVTAGNFTTAQRTDIAVPVQQFAELACSGRDDMLLESGSSTRVVPHGRISGC